MRKYSPYQRNEIDRQVADLLQAGAIENSSSPWSSAIVMVAKKVGEWRMCINYRRLNEVTIPDAYPIPNMEHLAQAKFFVSLDLKSGFHQIPMKESDKEKTAFAETASTNSRWWLLDWLMRH